LRRAGRGGARKKNDELFVLREKEKGRIEASFSLGRRKKKRNGKGGSAEWPAFLNYLPVRRGGKKGKEVADQTRANRGKIKEEGEQRPLAPQKGAGYNVKADEKKNTSEKGEKMESIYFSPASSSKRGKRRKKRR